MKVGELIDRLSEYSEDAEVHLMHQPRYPLESALGGVARESEVREHVGGDLGDDPEFVYLLEGRQIGYGRSVAWEAAEAGA